MNAKATANTESKLARPIQTRPREVIISVLLQIAGVDNASRMYRVLFYAAMPKIVWTNWRCATTSPLATQRT